MVERYRSVIVLPVWSNMTLIISISAIRLMVRAATIDLINSLSLWGNLDVLVYSTSRKIKFHHNRHNGDYYDVNFIQH
jgi:hypothetical protein